MILINKRTINPKMIKTIIGQNKKTHILLSDGSEYLTDASFKKIKKALRKSKKERVDLGFMETVK